MSNDADGTPGPEERFKILADETRLDILGVLADASGSAESPLSYSELQTRVGIRDNGRLNYHLSKLTDVFVDRTDEGYSLRPAGRFADLVARSQRPDAAGRTEMDAAAECHHCGCGLTAMLTPPQEFVVRCEECDRVYLTLTVPFARPGGDPSSFLAAMDETARERFGLAARGLCHWCRSPVQTEVTTGEDPSRARHPRRRHLDLHFHHRCETCAATSRTTPGELLLTHPEVVARHRRHESPLAERYVWEIAFAVTNRAVHVRSRDPWEIVLRTTVGDVDIEAGFDGEGNVQFVSGQSHLRGI